VPSDVIAGLVLLRKMQKSQREAIVGQVSDFSAKRFPVTPQKTLFCLQHCNDTYEFLSGVPVTPRTKFVALGEPDEMAEFQMVIHYMHFALGAYGWPMFLVTHSGCGVCRLCTKLR